MSAVPKPRRIRDPAAIAEARKPWCEYCGRWGLMEIHHVKSRGSGGHDVAENLVNLCVGCHKRVHNGQIPRRNIECIVRRRENG